MQLKTSGFLIGGALLYGLTLVPGLGAKYEQSQLLKTSTDRARLGNLQDIAVAKDAQERSKIALERVRAGCYAVATKAATGVFEAPLTENTPVVVGGVGTPVGVGSFVCNGSGETAVIVEGQSDTGESVSVMASVAKAAIADLPEYKRLFSAKNGNPSQPTQSPASTPTQPAPAQQKKAIAEVYP